MVHDQEDKEKQLGWCHGQGQLGRKERSQIVTRRDLQEAATRMKGYKDSEPHMPPMKNSQAALHVTQCCIKMLIPSHYVSQR